MEAEGNGEPSDAEPDRMDLELLAIGKKAGLTFDEINMFRVRDLIKFVQIYTGKDEETEVRQANQSDFDSFWPGQALWQSKHRIRLYTTML